MAERGRCGGCGKSYALNADGCIRGHTDPRGDGWPVSTRRSSACPGSWMPAIAPDEPLVRTQLAELRHELADSRKELTRLRAYARALEHDRNAWKLRVESLGYIHDANRHLLAALKSMMDSPDSAEREERFEADMAKIRAQFPDVLEERT